MNKIVLDIKSVNRFNLFCPFTNENWIMMIFHLKYMKVQEIIYFQCVKIVYF